jgi:hypothetical protein
MGTSRCGGLPLAPPGTSSVASSAEYQKCQNVGALPYLKIDGMLDRVHARSVFLLWLEGLVRKSVYFDVFERGCTKAFELIRVKW